MSTRPGDGERGGQTRSCQSSVRGGGQPVGQRTIHVAFQQLAGNGQLGSRPLHGGGTEEHCCVYTTDATRLRDTHVLGEQRVWKANSAMRVPGDSCR